jgi:hypothetical protein
MQWPKKRIHYSSSEKSNSESSVTKIHSNSRGFFQEIKIENHEVLSAMTEMLQTIDKNCR